MGSSRFEDVLLLGFYNVAFLSHFENQFERHGRAERQTHHTVDEPARVFVPNHEEERMHFFVLAPQPDTKVLPIPSFNCFLAVPLA